MSKKFSYYGSLQSLDPDAVAFLNAAGITDPTITSAINTLVIDLKAQNLWTKIKAMYPFVGATASTHKFNLKNPQDTNAAFRLSFIGGWTHSANGALPNGTTGYADTYFTTLANQTATSGHFALYSRTAAASTENFAGHGVANTLGVSHALMGIRRPAGQRFFSMYGEGAGQIVFAAAETDARGFYLGTRIASNSLVYQKNGSTIASTTVTVGAATLINISYYLSAFNQNNAPRANSYDNKELAFASIGDGLTTAEATTYYNLVQAFQTTLNRQV
jgi:hypothetical protein